MMNNETTSNSQHSVTNQEPKETRTSIVDILFDMGSSWIHFGQKVQRGAIEQSSKSLERLTTKSNRETDGGIEAFAQTIVDLGAGWTSYGLTVGKEALQQSAKSLEQSAKLLGAFAKEFKTFHDKS